MSYVRWFTRIKRKNGNQEKLTGKETYLLDHFPDALDTSFVISKEFPRTDNDKAYFKYTTFDSYFDIYHYINKLPPYERRLHEVINEHRVQKPRFDIDVDYDNYQLAIDIEDRCEDKSIAELGDYMKDMVIHAIITVMKLKGYVLDMEMDFMIFTSHGKDKKRHDKRSYHIILNRYFHYGCDQASAFYKECCMVAEEPELFELLVDKSIYGRGRSLRLLWSTKVNNPGRVKKYVPDFTYEGKKYTHRIEVSKEDDIKDLNIELRQMRILANSLITFVDEAVPMPIFPVKQKAKHDNIEISDEAYNQCKELIKKWDSESVFEIEGSDGGVINLSRLYPSMCPICKRIHDNMPSFCYISQAQLYWHCGRAEKRPGIPIGRIKSIKSDIELRLERILKGGHIRILDEDEQLIRDNEIETAPAKIETIYNTIFRLKDQEINVVNAIDKEEKTVVKRPLPVNIAKIVNKTIVKEEIKISPENPKKPPVVRIKKWKVKNVDSSLDVSSPISTKSTNSLRDRKNNTYRVTFDR